MAERQPAPSNKTGGATFPSPLGDGDRHLSGHVDQELAGQLGRGTVSPVIELEPEVIAASVPDLNVARATNVYNDYQPMCGPADALDPAPGSGVGSDGGSVRIVCGESPRSVHDDREFRSATVLLPPLVVTAEAAGDRYKRHGQGASDTSHSDLLSAEADSKCAENRGTASTGESFSLFCHRQCTQESSFWFLSTLPLTTNYSASCQKSSAHHYGFKRSKTSMSYENVHKRTHNRKQ